VAPLAGRRARDPGRTAILKNNLDRADDQAAADQGGALPAHPNVRGSSYYH
jgi:hypothetical protein